LETSLGDYSLNSFSTPLDMTYVGVAELVRYYFEKDLATFERVRERFRVTGRTS